MVDGVSQGCCRVVLQEERMQGGCCRMVDARGKEARLMLQSGRCKRKRYKVDNVEWYMQEETMQVG